MRVAISIAALGPTRMHELRVEGVVRAHGALGDGDRAPAASAVVARTVGPAFSIGIVRQDGAEMRVSGSMPWVRAVASTKGLNEEPAWRGPWVARFSLAIGLGAEEVAAAHHRPHVARARLHRRRAKRPARWGRGGSPLTAASAWACATRSTVVWMRSPPPKRRSRRSLARRSEAGVVEDPLLHLLHEVRGLVALGGGHHGRGELRAGVVTSLSATPASVIKSLASIRSSTSWRRSSASSGSSKGSVAPGRWISPAISAPSARVRSVAGLPKYWWAAASIP